MFGGIFYRSIAWQLVTTLAFTLAALTGIMLAACVLREATLHGLGLWQTVMVAIYFVPATLPYTLPSAGLFAACLVYGRLARDLELMALRSCGLSMLGALLPGLTVGLAVAGMLGALYVHVIPSAVHGIHAVLAHGAEELIQGRLRNRGNVSLPGNRGALFVRGIDGENLIEPVFRHGGSSEGAEVVAHARRGRLRLDALRLNLLLDLDDGTMLQTGTMCWFRKMTVEVALSAPVATSPADSQCRELTTRQLLQRRDQSEAEAAEERDGSEERRRAAQKLICFLKIELQKRPAVAVGCFCFVIVGCAAGACSARADYLSAFVACFLPVMFLYYTLLLTGISLASKGRWPPSETLWFGDIAIGLLGLVLCWRVVRR